jgi:thiamine kinase-like enzyme
MFKGNLQALLVAPNIKYMHKEIIESALFDLDDSKWKPELVSSHNDIWLGNVMLSSESRFVIIDWDGSIDKGYPFYDLIRALSSFKLGHNKTKKAIDQYCNLMQCDHKQAQYYLLSAFAHQYQNLGAWPYQSFLDTMDSSMDLLINHQ